nr:retrotransposon protein putative Ty1-copia subclass [Tanacetum cinerariifolium]
MDIYMLVEKEYPLSRGILTQMLCAKLLVEEDKESFGYLFYKPKDNVVFVAQRGVFFKREMICKEDSGSKIDLEEIQESADEEPIVNTNTQQEAVIPVEPDDISLPICRISSRMDVKTAFFNEKLTEDVFMAQPEGFENAKFLVFGGEEELRVTGHCDASCQTNKDDSCSQFGCVFLLNGGAVTWESLKQNTMADSTCESKYIAAYEASKEAIWIER